MNRRRLTACGAALIGIVAVLTPGCRTPSFTDAIDPVQEKTIGDWAAAQIQSESIGPTDPAITEEVNQIAKRLDQSVSMTPKPRILISDSDYDSVSSLPGGWVIVSARMAALFENDPDALAGLMAHEYAHVENHDAARQMSSALGDDTIVDMTTQGKYTDAANVAVQMTTFSHDLDDEYHVDGEGVRIAAASGYDPHGILSAIAVLSRLTPSTDAVWLQVHPVTSKRLKLLASDIAQDSSHTAIKPGNN